MRRSRTRLYLFALVLLVACDIPTSLPIYQTAWSVPVKGATISVNALLPAQVLPTTDSSAFQVSLEPSSVTIARSLSQDCSMCALANGVSIPKPPFSGSGTVSFAFPSNVTSATLVRDTLTVTIANGFNFDPLRPGASARGYLTLSVQNAGTLVGRDSIDGAVTPLPAFATLVRKIPLSGTVTASGGLQVGMQVYSPAGDPVTMDASGAITISGSVGAVFLSQVLVDLANQSVSARPNAIDLSGVDSAIVRRASGATLQMTMNNPFNVSGKLALTFTGQSAISKSVAIASGMTTPSVTFTASEIQSLLGRNVTIAVAGTVSGSGVVIEPRQSLSVTSRLVLTLDVGGK